MPSEEGHDKPANNEKNGGGVFQAETQDVYDEAALDPVYQAKARILNDALQDIGMGKYQASSLHSSSLHAPLTPTLFSGSCLSSLALVGYRECRNALSNQVADTYGKSVITCGR